MVQDELDEQLLPLFIEEAIDLNQNIAAQLRAWRSSPADPEPVRRLARLFHSLKGSARMAGAMNLGNLTHAIETRMKEAQDDGAAPVELIDDIDNAFDVIIQLVERLQRGETADTPLEISDAAALELVGEAAAAAGEAEQAIASVPRPEGQETEAEAAAQRTNLRVRADLIDRLVNEAGELSIARLRIEGEMRGIKASLLDLTENVIRLRRQLREIEIQAELQMQSRTAVTDRTARRLRSARVRPLHALPGTDPDDGRIGKRRRHRAAESAEEPRRRQRGDHRPGSTESRSAAGADVGAHGSRSSSIADRLYRIVRQASKDTGKRANLEIRGAQLELDRSVLDKMLAPARARVAQRHGARPRGCARCVGPGARRISARSR
jgi:chemosensory pili system protein ChpA (sensor histidine kinase/response regulator)